MQKKHGPFDSSFAGQHIDTPTHAHLLQLLFPRQHHLHLPFADQDQKNLCGGAGSYNLPPPRTTNSKKIASSSSNWKERLVLVVDAACQRALERDGEGWTAKPDFVLALSHVVEQLCAGSFASDLMAFSAHAKRKTVAEEDVLLLLRRCPDLVKRVELSLERDRLAMAKAAASAAAAAAASSSAAAAAGAKNKRPAASAAASAASAPKRQQSVESSSEEDDDADSQEGDEDYARRLRQQNEEEELFND